MKPCLGYSQKKSRQRQARQCFKESVGSHKDNFYSHTSVHAHNSGDHQRKQMGLDPEDVKWNDAFVFDMMGGQQVRKGAPIFPRLDIEKELEELEAMKNGGEENVPLELKPEIEFDDFDKIDFRVGTIISAEKHPKADKLLVFQVKMGTEKRQIISGVAQQFKPEECVGKKFSLLRTSSRESSEALNQGNDNVCGQYQGRQGNSGIRKHGCRRRKCGDVDVFDSHAHINEKSFSKEAREAVIEAVEASKVDYVTDIGYDLESSKLAADHAAKYTWCYAAVGCHPHDTKSMDEIQLAMIKLLAKKKRRGGSRRDRS